MNNLMVLSSRQLTMVTLLLLSVLTFILCLVVLFQLSKQPQIAIIRSEEIVYGYAGMKEAHESFQKKVQQWQTNQKVLEEDFQTALSSYEKVINTLSPEEKRKKESNIIGMQQNLEKYSNNIAELIKQEDIKMTQAVLNQINSFIQDYAVKYGYDIVMGTTESGNILYGDRGFDITDPFLQELNNYYLGQGEK